MPKTSGVRCAPVDGEPSEATRFLPLPARRGNDLSTARRGVGDLSKCRGGRTSAAHPLRGA